MKEIIVNTQLEILYSEYFRRNIKPFMAHSLLGHGIANPYLIKVDESYDNCLLSKH